MSANQPDVCAIGLTPETLSQWRDRVLDAAAARAVAQHIDTCAACQAWLQSFEATAQRLRQRYVPPTGASLWREVQQRIAIAERRHRRHPTQVWRGLGAAAAALLIGALFAYALRGHVGTTSRLASASPTALVPIALQWRQATTPTGMSNYYGANEPDIAFAPDDSTTAYACFVSGSTGSDVALLWATHDGATTSWRQVQSITASRFASPNNGCHLTVDGGDSLIVVATTGVPKFSLSQSFVSFNGGQSWQALTQWPFVGIQQSLTLHTTTYILRGNGLEISTDRWQTLHAIDGQITAAGESVAHIWLDPATGALLALGDNKQDHSGSTTTGHLWQTRDSGAHWTELAPAPTISYGAVFAQPPAAGHSWQICGQRYDDTAGNVHPYTLECSVDGGQSWQQRPLLEHTSNGLFITSMNLIGLAHDGTVIENVDSPAPATLYSATAASTWRSLGAIPANNVAFSDDGKRGMLWDYGAIPAPLFTVAYP